MLDDRTTEFEPSTWLITVLLSRQLGRGTNAVTEWAHCQRQVAFFSVVDVTPNYEALFAKFCRLSYFDQHAVTSACATHVIEQIQSFAGSASSYLPLVDNVSYLFDMMEHCYNISGLIDFIIQVILKPSSFLSSIHLL